VVDIPALGEAGVSASANRVVLRKGRHLILVYYWIKQQEKTFASENYARVDRLLSSLFENRTDGALVRVIRPILDEDATVADRRIRDFIGQVNPLLPTYIPL
tara:strand:- start:446 stop:751 length:306 start_codon:yes stop_codon:yes gene_type:complete